MVQGEPWGLHGFFSTFRLACSNLRQENEEVWRCSSLSSICWDYVLNGKCSDWCPVECVGCYHCGVMCFDWLPSLAAIVDWLPLLLLKPVYTPPVYTLKKCPVSANCIASVLFNNGKWQDHTPEAKCRDQSASSNLSTVKPHVPSLHLWWDHWSNQDTQEWKSPWKWQHPYRVFEEHGTWSCAMALMLPLNLYVIINHFIKMEDSKGHCYSEAQETSKWS